jgi:hypothetical protein
MNGVLARRLHDRDLRAGLLFLTIGAAALVLGRDLTIGTAAEMGEGYVPRAMAVALLAFGALLVVLTFARGSHIAGPSDAARDPFRWRALAFVTGAVLVFAAALQPLGLIPATTCSVVAANFAGQPLSLRSLAILICALSAVVAVVFVWGLGLPLHLLPR